MFEWLRRRGGAPAPDQRTPEAQPKSAAPPRPGPERRPPRQTDPAPLPEVVAEGNTQADWSMWEDSMTALDSQFQAVDPSARVQVRETRPSQLDDPDAFASVRQKRPR